MMPIGPSELAPLAESSNALIAFGEVWEAIDASRVFRVHRAVRTLVIWPKLSIDLLAKLVCASLEVSFGGFQMGVIQIRLVAGVWLLLSAISIAVLLVQVTLFGTPFEPAKFAPAILWIGLVFLLLKGSKVARIMIAVVSVISAAGSLPIAVLLALTPPGATFLEIVIWVSFGVISAGIAYLLLFSKDLKEEVLRRAEVKQSREQLDRQKYYKSLGEQYKE
jgi:hypothetical protein